MIMVGVIFFIMFNLLMFVVVIWFVLCFGVRWDVLEVKLVVLELFCIIDFIDYMIVIGYGWVGVMVGDVL